MKKHLLLFLLLPLAFISSCSKPGLDAVPFGIGIKVSDFPAYDGTTRAIGTPDEGKTAWEDNDCIYICASTQAKADAGRWRLTFTSGKWDRLEKYEDGSYVAVGSIALGAPSRLTACYAPDFEFTQEGLSPKQGSQAGSGEYLSWESGTSFNVTATSDINIVLDRSYSRLRVVAEAGATVRLNCSVFIPAGSETAGGEIATTADSNGNAFFYGKWSKGATMAFTAHDALGTLIGEVTLTDRPKSIDGASYALECTMDFTTIAELSATATTTSRSFSDIVVRNVIVTCIYGKYAHIEDASGGIMVFADNHGLNAGDCIIGPISGKIVLYDGNKTVSDSRKAYPELTYIDYSKASVTSVATLPKTEVTLDAIISDFAKYANMRVLVKDITVTTGVSTTVQTGYISQNGTSMQIFNKSKEAVIETGAEGDIIGYPVYYKGTLQLLIYETDQFSEGQSEPAEDNAFTRITVPGIYDITGLYVSGSVSPIKQSSSTDQCGSVSGSGFSSFRIQNIPGGELFKIDLNAARIKTGTTASYESLTVSGGSVSGLKGSVKAIKAESGLVWLKDTGNNRGYIINVVK